MQQEYEPQPGTPIAQLDTPCLILDMDALDHNMDVIADYYGDRHSKLRGHSKNHKSPALALRQIQRGGTVGGVCAAKVAEAEVMVQGGVASVFVTSEVVAPPKIARLCALAHQAEILVACENEANARDLSEAAAAQGVNLGVIIEQETGLLRCGVREVETRRSPGPVHRFTARPVPERRDEPPDDVRTIFRPRGPGYRSPPPHPASSGPSGSHDRRRTVSGNRIYGRNLELRYCRGHA